MKPVSAFAGIGAVASRAVLERGHLYSGGAPGLALVLFPVREIARRCVPERLLVLVLTLVGAALPLAAGAVAVKRAVIRGTGCTEEVAMLAGALHAFGTIALSFATRLYAHSLTVALLAGALAALLDQKKGSARFVLAGFLAGLAVVCDYNVAIPATALGLLALLRGGVSGAVGFTLGTVPPALLLMGYQWACFGSPFHTPYDHHADPGTQAIVKEGYGFSHPRPRIVLELLFGRRRGFLWTQPAVLLGVFGLVRRGRLFAVALGTTALVVLANAARAHDWAAGSSYGARYAAAVLPFVALGYPRGLEALGRARIPFVIATFVAAGPGACTDWGRSIQTNWDSLRLLGPRASGLHSVLLGISPEEASWATALVGTVALALSVPLAWKILRPGVRLQGLVALALGLSLLGAPGLATAFIDGEHQLKRTRGEIGRREIRRAIDAAELDEARSLEGITYMMRDEELFRAAVARVRALEASERSR